MDGWWAAEFTYSSPAVSNSEGSCCSVVPSSLCFNTQKTRICQIGITSRYVAVPPRHPVQVHIYIYIIQLQTRGDTAENNPKWRVKQKSVAVQGISRKRLVVRGKVEMLSLSVIIVDFVRNM